MSSVLCIGSGDSLASKKTRYLAIKKNIEYKGILNEINETPSGCYHTSIYDLDFNAMVSAGKFFNKVYLLDQPTSAYTNWYDFHQTIEVVNVLKDFTNVEFINLSQDNNYITYQKKNKSFCLMPFIALRTGTEGFSACSYTTKDITPVIANFNFYDNSEFTKLRNDVLLDNKPEVCNRCYELEERNVLSPRQLNTSEWSFRLNLHNPEQIKTSLAYYHVKLGNECNLMCRMCHPQQSVLLDKEFYELKFFPDRQGLLHHNYFDNIDLDTVQSVHIAGGEPTIDKTFHAFLHKCIENNKTDFEIVFTTNVVAVTDEFLNLCSHFSNMQIMISIDAYRNANTYIRWPASWDKVISNIEKFLTTKHSLAFNTVVSIYNIFSLYDLLEFLQQTYPSRPVHLSYVDSTIVPSAWEVPNKKIVIDQVNKIKTLEIYQKQKLVKTKIDGIELTVKKEKVDLVKLANFFDYNDKLDESRKVKLIDYIPELEQCRSYITKQT